MDKRNQIGMAVAIVGVVSAGVGVGWIVAHRPAPPSGPVIKQAAYIPPPPLAQAQAPVRFIDVTAQTGIQYMHFNGQFTKLDGKESRYMPETMGPGVVLFDYDRDGRLDIFAPNGCDLSGKPTDQSTPTARLYRNEGGLRFTDTTVEAGLAVVACGMGAAAADYDGDGHSDLLVTTWGGPRLFRNQRNGTFRDVTRAMGLVSEGWTDAKGRRGPDWSTGAAFFDADGDGRLDILVLNYVQWSPETDVFSTIDGKNKSYATPELYSGNSSRLYLQRKGEFVDATKSSGIFNVHGKSLGIALWDFDNDGRLDVVVANDTQPNFLYRNLGGGRFEERGLEAGVAYDENGRTRAGMGIDVADYLNDGSSGVAIANFSKEPASLYKATSPGFFREASQQSGVATPTYLCLKFGLLFADLDLDGWQDMVLANGHIEPRVEAVESEITYREPLVLLGNAQNGRFVDWSKEAGPAFQMSLVGRGLAAGDLDGDGKVDLVVTENGGPLHVLRNDRPTAHHYVRVHLKGRAPNTDAIGAKIEVVAGDLTQRRWVRTGSSYLSQSELTQTFGLGSRTKIDRIAIIWPGGDRTELQPPAVDRELVIQE